LEFQFLGEGASGAIKSRIETFTPKLKFEPEVFSSNSRLVIFGKPEAHKGRRMGVVLVSGADALRRAQELVQKVEVVG
jgi:phosphoribosylglycinamide formyltransferase 2